jgi:hypothetical protein
VQVWLRAAQAVTCEGRVDDERRDNTSKQVLITSLGFVAALLWAVSPASALVPSTVRVSLSSTGSQLGLYSGTPTISADGPWVMFDAYDPKAFRATRTTPATYSSATA